MAKVPITEEEFWLFILTDLFNRLVETKSWFKSFRYKMQIKGIMKYMEKELGVSIEYDIATKHLYTKPINETQEDIEW